MVEGRETWEVPRKSKHEDVGRKHMFARLRSSIVLVEDEDTIKSCALCGGTLR